MAKRTRVVDVEIDARFHPIVKAMDSAIHLHNLLAGENLYLLTVLLRGAIDDVPDDVRWTFRRCILGALADPVEYPGNELADLCLRLKAKP